MAEFFHEEDVEIARQSAIELYQTGFLQINPLRWERVRKEIRFTDLVESVQGTSSLKISCPFHGRDSRPSFQLYPRTNDAYCFGCSEYFDHVLFIAKKFDMSRGEALSWLESEYNLPPMDDVEREEEEDEEEETTASGPLLSFGDLCGPYIMAVPPKLFATLDPEQARQYAAIFFEAWPRKDSADEDPEEQVRRLKMMARAMGQEAVSFAKAQKGSRA